MDWYLVVITSFSKEELLLLGIFTISPRHRNTVGSSWIYLSSDSKNQNPISPWPGGQQVEPGTKWHTVCTGTAHHVHMVAGIWDPGVRWPVLRPTTPSIIRSLNNPLIHIVHHSDSICPVFHCQHIAEVVDWLVLSCLFMVRIWFWIWQFNCGDPQGNLSEVFPFRILKKKKKYKYIYIYT